jgi:8-oxo-dGTP diphosphatase
MKRIEKAGLLAIRDGRVLLCRKSAGTALLILPGGKYEPGETAEVCLAREIAEELGAVRMDGVRFVGTYEDRAAGAEATTTVRSDLYAAELIGEPAPSSEIRELIWFGEHDDRSQLSPSLRNKILPDLAARGMLAWKSWR